MAKLASASCSLLSRESSAPRARAAWRSSPSWLPWMVYRQEIIDVSCSRGNALRQGEDTGQIGVLFLPVASQAIQAREYAHRLMGQFAAGPANDHQQPTNHGWLDTLRLRPVVQHADDLLSREGNFFFPCQEELERLIIIDHDGIFLRTGRVDQPGRPRVHGYLPLCLKAQKTGRPARCNPGRTARRRFVYVTLIEVRSLAHL